MVHSNSCTQTGQIDATVKIFTFFFHRSQQYDRHACVKPEPRVQVCTGIETEKPLEKLEKCLGRYLYRVYLHCVAIISLHSTNLQGSCTVCEQLVWSSLSNFPTNLTQLKCEYQKRLHLFASGSTNFTNQYLKCALIYHANKKGDITIQFKFQVTATQLLLNQEHG